MDIELPRNKHLLGPARARFAAVLKKSYSQGSSVRELSEMTGRSYGWIHRMLKEAEVEFRSRGGSGRHAAR